MIRTLSLPVVAYDTNLAGIASSIDDAIAAACAGLEARGFEPISVSTLRMSASEDVGDASKSSWSSEHGVIATITYRGADRG